MTDPALLTIIGYGAVCFGLGYAVRWCHEYLNALYWWRRYRSVYMKHDR